MKVRSGLSYHHLPAVPRDCICIDQTVCRSGDNAGRTRSSKPGCHPHASKANPKINGTVDRYSMIPINSPSKSASTDNDPPVLELLQTKYRRLFLTFLFLVSTSGTILFFTLFWNDWFHRRWVMGENELSAREKSIQKLKQKGMLMKRNIPTGPVRNLATDR